MSFTKTITGITAMLSVALACQMPVGTQLVAPDGPGTALGMVGAPRGPQVLFSGAGGPASTGSKTFQRGVPQPHAFALIVGISDYRDVPDVPGAANDARDFAKLAEITLGVPPDHIRVLVDDRATRVDIKKALKWLEMNVPDRGKVYFYFSGHGSPDAKSKSGYLIPYDGDPAYLSDTGIGLNEILDQIAASKASEVVGFVDSCFSGTGGRSVLPKGARPVSVVSNPKPPAKVSVFTAATGAQIAGPIKSGESGLFSHTILQGLGSAAADGDGDGRVTMDELEGWVEPRVKRTASQEGREQTPVLIEGKQAKGLFVTLGYVGESVDVGGGAAAAPSPMTAASGTPQTDPAAGTGAVPTETAKVDRPAPTGGKNWAKAGGIVGIIAAGVTGLLGAASTAYGYATPTDTTEEWSTEATASMGFGIGATLVLLAGVPVAYMGGRSARRSAGVDGNKGLRISSWVSYGASGAGAIGLVATGIADQPPPLLIVGVTVLGAAACALMGAEALIANKQTKKATTAQTSQIGFGVAPLPGRTGVAGGVVGVGGRF